MKNLVAGAIAATLVASPALAGGLDRSGMGISALFEAGNYAELGFSAAAPEVSGTLAGVFASGNMASSFFMPGMAVKADVTDKLSVALQFEQAYGAAVDYTNTDPSYPIQGFTAALSGLQTSVLARYKLSDRISVHGGVRLVSMSGTVDFTAAGGTPVTYGTSNGIGYAIGAAYEIPDIALRASVTYNSATTHDNPITDPTGGLQTTATTTGSYTLPQSVNIDFQTGIAANTLLMASVRWADWSATALNTQTSLGTISYANDVFTYSLGIGHRFTDKLSGVAQVSYEAADGLAASNLSPTDGKIGVSLAGVYDLTDAITVTAGVNYTALGDATTQVIGANFSGNSSLGAGLKIGIHF